MIYSYINTRENWKNSKLCENTPPCGRRVSTQFLVFPISTRVDITVYQHGKCFIFLKYNMRIIIYKLQHFIFITVSEEIRSAVTSLSPRRTIFLGNSPSTETDFLGISPLGISPSPLLQVIAWDEQIQRFFFVRVSFAARISQLEKTRKISENGFSKMYRVQVHFYQEWLYSTTF